MLFAILPRAQCVNEKKKGFHIREVTIVYEEQKKPLSIINAWYSL